MHGYNFKGLQVEALIYIMAWLCQHKIKNAPRDGPWFLLSKFKA